MTLTVATVDGDGPGTKLAATTVNRVLAAVSSFYEYVIMAGQFDRANPIENLEDIAYGRRRVVIRHRTGPETLAMLSARQLPAI
jgi:site-specific recombinase XerD